MTEQTSTENVQAAENNHIIECENLVKIYKTREIEVLALQGLELTVDYGELMAIIGNSGSGKSTFLNMVGGLDRPSAGRLIVDGKDLFKLTEQELVLYKRHTVGFVWQNNARNLLPYLNAQQNIQLPMSFNEKLEDNGVGKVRLSRDKKTRALELLELVGMSHRKNSKLNQLSGGEQQRIAIALALANNPRLLLADEPTGSVDVKTAGYILSIFRELSKELGTTIMIVTHDKNIAHMVNRTVAIRDGKTSTEFIVKEDYRDRLADITGFGTIGSEAQDEFAVLDRAGRLQIPADLLERLELKGNKVRLNYENGRVVITPPDR